MSLPPRHVWLSAILVVLLTASTALNVFVYKKTKSLPKQNQEVQGIDDIAKISQIEAYLDKIEPQYVADIQKIASDHGVPSWGCGPSSYALAKIINKKFFDDKLTIDASYDNHPYEIVERFGLAKVDPKDHHGLNAIDHAWMEIYFKDKFLFIDPTAGQFVKTNQILYHLFEIGDDKIANELFSNYSIVDTRLTLLIDKAINRIPDSQEPYPGIGINSKDLPYYLQVQEERQLIDSNREPVDWKDWTDILLPKYLGAS